MARARPDDVLKDTVRQLEQRVTELEKLLATVSIQDSDTLTVGKQIRVIRGKNIGCVGVIISVTNCMVEMLVNGRRVFRKRKENVEVVRH